MKKEILSIVAIAIMAFSTQAYADNDSGTSINLEVSIYDPTGNIGGPHKGPVLIPEVSLDGHTLYFFTPCDGFTLNLVDENEVVVYTIVIPTGATSLVLPATLSGDFELQLISGNYCFWGWIGL